MLYQIRGSHPVYGSDLPLYIEKTNNFSSVKLDSIKKLLVIANHPLYNTKYKNEETVGIPYDMRIFNTGQMGRILPEISGTYFLNRWHPSLSSYLFR